jgi:hypothetical protein
MIKLSEIRAARAVMTQEGREALCAEDPRAVELALRLVAAGPKAHAVSASETHEICDALLAVYGDSSPGIVATHNAADDLITIAEAALAWSNAKRDFDDVRWLLEDAKSDAEYMASSDLISLRHRTLASCTAALRLALAKVEP